tara:strand:+ start:881 stop:1408 length:528 start_codon:yes stop_codon:yes gene_type:complete
LEVRSSFTASVIRSIHKKVTALAGPNMTQITCPTAAEIMKYRCNWVARLQKTSRRFRIINSPIKFLIVEEDTDKEEIKNFCNGEVVCAIDLQPFEVGDVLVRMCKSSCVLRWPSFLNLLKSDMEEAKLAEAILEDSNLVWTFECPVSKQVTDFSVNLSQSTILSLLDDGIEEVVQ